MKNLSAILINFLWLQNELQHFSLQMQISFLIVFYPSFITKTLLLLFIIIVNQYELNKALSFLENC